MPGVSHGVLDCLPSTQETQASEALAAVCAALHGVLTGTAKGRCVCVALRGPLSSCGCPTGACVDTPPPGHRCPTQSSDDVPSVSPWPWPCHGAPCRPLPRPSEPGADQGSPLVWSCRAQPRGWTVLAAGTAASFSKRPRGGPVVGGWRARLEPLHGCQRMSASGVSVIR